jgi:uridine monophosphate synthetase
LRDSQKTYGTQKLIEGNYDSSTKVLLIDDVLTTGTSVINTIESLKNNNIETSKVLVILDRSNNTNTIQNVYSLFTLEDIMNIQNANFYNNIQSNSLYKLILNKKSNIILSCDLIKSCEILEMINKIGEYIIAIKLHSDLIQDFNDDFIEKLITLKKKYNLLIIEDRKFSDIGSIVIKQMNGPLRIKDWADMVTTHTICGIESIKCLEQEYPNIGAILITELSSFGNLITDTYTNNSLEFRKQNNVCGLVCQANTLKKINPYEIITFTPGINLNISKDNHGQTYTNVKSENNKTGMVWIIGRGIYEHENPIEKVKEYKELGWKHFKEI